MSDASDFQHALFDNTSWPEPIEVKARSSASLVLTALLGQFLTMTGLPSLASFLTHRKPPNLSGP
ncbi:hypothetical protein CROQUDRAFT_102506 [Cronartium quercuum f. sp. fusiforme G11]|uniref:Uncharacterized protein n=1 Tax=Cronartium quercuum f. sp. fusiforme G11 TaxID=708437 RepID=A0A9P6T4X3_9BASI|nr:hypothetical protein CROQUDRAFT_102506 [Cronartium quercuum f. sp. fusiforme G11]